MLFEKIIMLFEKLPSDIDTMTLSHRINWLTAKIIMLFEKL